MITIGLDNALNTTGWSIFKDEELIAHSTFSIPAYKSIEVRLGEIWNKLNDLYREYQFEYVYFEDIQQQRGNVQTFKKLAYVQAAILLWCYFNEIKYTIFAPSHWRSTLKSTYGLGFGNARAEQKKKAQELVKQIFKIDVTEDEADAICIGLGGIQERIEKKSAF